MPTREHILETFHSYGAPRERWLIGGEFERILLRPDGSSIGYNEPHGIRWLLEEMAAEGWAPQREEGNLIALLKDGASITLEPGGQFELSGAPFATLAELKAEIEENRDTILRLSQGKPVVPVAIGLTPFTAIDQISWMPKGRYTIMQEYLPGSLAHYMMKGTASVQCNYDYTDEADCAAKVKLAAGLAPLTTALFANSPIYNGEPTGWMSYRGHIWTKTDPDRTGFPPGLRDDYTHERWVDYLLAVPMMFYKRGKQWLPANGRPFSEYMTRGFDGHFPTMDDWNLHMTSVFPEVRTKQTIEVRGADCVSLPMSVAFCALFTGLLYGRSALSDALTLSEDLSAQGTREARLEAACREGLQATVGGRTLAAWSAELLELAAAGLAEHDPAGAPLLDPLRQQVDTGRSPAADLLEAFTQAPSPAALVEHLRY
ncbi:MAG: glutamate-cysteine ligase family protein [Myxococcota bacterium]|nr:glutamate-cysteine ligase family protein [Myxococcota bacterium]